MPKIQGIPVTLIERREIGRDALNAPIYEETETVIENVLVAPATSDDIVDTTDLEGKKLVYTLAIPKGDTHSWIDVKVRFWGRTFKSFGFPTEGIEANIPLDWNKKVTVELYE